VTAHLRPTRRAFLRSTAALAAVPFLGPHAWRRRPLATLNVAGVGVGGMGRADLDAVATGPQVRIVALCDVDQHNLDAAASAHAGAKTFRDFRRMFDAMERDIDAVVVSTPDHMHAPVAIAALQRKKHVYCQKPLAHNLRECRRMADLAAAQGVATQMGVQIHAHEAYRTAVATLRAGAIGKVREVHTWVDRSWAGPIGGRPRKQDKVPEHLDWDLWLGVAAERSYVENVYHPANWRGFVDFGTGTLGDMGCHILDPVFTALSLGAPVEVTYRGEPHGDDSFVADGDVRYRFAATEHTDGELTLRWTDGKARPDAARAQLPEKVQLPGGGSFLVGERGVMVLPHWAMPRCYREGRELDVALEKCEARNHWHEWTAACRGEGTTSTPFSYAGPLTEAVLLGSVAGRFPGRQLRWDAAKLELDDRAATALVGRSYRKGWELD
jgi:predicted dehydrogenase